MLFVLLFTFFLQWWIVLLYSFEMAHVHIFMAFFFLNNPFELSQAENISKWFKSHCILPIPSLFLSLLYVHYIVSFILLCFFAHETIGLATFLRDLKVVSINGLQHCSLGHSPENTDVLKIFAKKAFFPSILRRQIVATSQF